MSVSATSGTIFQFRRYRGEGVNALATVMTVIDRNVREIVMKIAVLAACIAGIALSACRREEPTPFYEPMKLGAKVDRTVTK